MARKKLIRSRIFPYHVVLRCNNREWFKLPLDRVWGLTSDELYRISLLCGAKIHSFVLMSNHLHLMISTPELDLGVVMSEFGGSMTRLFNRISGRSGHLFGGPYKWSVIQSSLYYATALKYVYRNPVRAGVVEKVEDYSYSSLSGILGSVPLRVPLHPPSVEWPGADYVPEDFGEMLRWLNEPFRVEVLKALDMGLRRKVFELPRETNSGSKAAWDEYLAPSTGALLPKK